MACNYVLIETYSKADKTLLMNRRKTETAHMSSYESFLFKKIASDKSQNKLYWSPKDHLWHWKNGSWIIQHNYCHSEKKQSENESSACGRFVNIHMLTWHLELWHLELWHLEIVLTLSIFWKWGPDSGCCFCERIWNQWFNHKSVLSWWHPQESPARLHCGIYWILYNITSS